MPRKELYLAAEEFQKAKLWETLYDAELFGVRYQDGETGYVSVMGRAKQHFAMALYMDEAGLYSYHRLSSLTEGASASLRRDCFLSQECLSCSFEKDGELMEKDRAEQNLYGLTYTGRAPLFRKYAPFKYPWYVEDPLDENRLLLALRAGFEVSKRLLNDSVIAAMTDPKGGGLEEVKCRLGFSNKTLPVLKVQDGGFSWTTENLPDEWEIENHVPILQNDLAAARLKKLNPEAGRFWYCHVTMYPGALDGEPPRFPAFMLLLDTEKGIAHMPPVSRYPEQMQEMIGPFLDYVAQQGKPQCVYALGKRTYDLLHSVAEQIGLFLIEKDRIPELEEVEDDLIAYIDAHGSNVDSELSPAGTDGTVPASKKTSKRTAGTQRASTKGICALCGESVDKPAVLRHLKKCVKRETVPGEQRYFLIKVEGADASEYFLYLDVMADTTLRRLDEYLRDIWLECCGHMSVFTIRGEEYYSFAMEPGDRGMNYKLEKLLEQSQSFQYEYDFGSYTDLKLKVAGEYTAKRRRNKIMLLARNEAPQFACVSCKKPATLVRADCGYDIAGNAYCDDCAVQEEEGFLPITNSPRCGVCAYGLEWEEEDGDE